MIDPRTFYNFADVPLYIGYHGENLVTGVDIDLANVLPDGWGAALLLRRPGEGKHDEYEAVSTLEGSTLHVTFVTFDTMLEGRGEATIELRGPNGEKQKSNTALTSIPHALDLSGVPPERPELYRTAAQQDVIDAGKLSKAAQAAKTADMTQPVGVDDDGKLWALPGGGGGSSDELWRPTVDSAGNISWEKSASQTAPATQNIKGKPGAAGRDGTDGQDGRDGTDGEDGFSPAVTVAQITGGHRVSITDKTHPSGQSFDVLDGEDGSQGAPGRPGADGHSPVVTATKSGKVTTVKVDGTDIATINDGNDGADGTDGADGLTTSVTVNGETITQVGGNINIGTVLRAHQDISGKADKPTIKTTMNSVAAANTQYFLGTQSAVSITLPSTGISVGDEILVCFTSGATAATLTCDLTGFDFTPKANKTSWLKFTCYDATNGDWLVETKEG